MTSFKGRRARLGTLLAVALGAISIFVLPGLASARGGSDDGDASATVKSFDQTTRTLVVDLPDGQSVSGLVTRRTKIRCEDQRSHRHGHGIRGREAEPGDDHGGHGNEPGDDNGGRGLEPGDDNGGGNSGPGSGSDQSGPSGHDDNGSGANCTTADLVPGAAVEEIELEFRGDTVVFDEVELDD
jgi:hypothetical protein